MEISKRPDEEFRQGSPRTHTAARGLKAGNSCPCPFSEEGWVVPLVGEGGSKLVGWGLRGGLGGLPIPLVVLCAGIIPCFCSQHLGKWLLVLTFFYLLVRHFPDCACVQLFLVPYSLVEFCCYETRCLSRCTHFGKGSQVPAYLTCGPA